MNARPAADEFAPYYGKYIDLVEGNDVMSALDRQSRSTRAALAQIDEAKGIHRYAPGKWSIKEVVGHLIDAERVFAYRALRIARADETPLAGFDENDYVRNANFDATPLSALADEFALVRQANLAMFRQFGEPEWQRRGTASGKTVSVRALAYIIAGHELHHFALLQTRYLTA
ncbi:MAG: DinB family protein [Gemmatimonadales bacterium]